MHSALVRVATDDLHIFHSSCYCSLVIFFQRFGLASACLQWYGHCNLEYHFENKSYLYLLLPPCVFIPQMKSFVK